jgi:hypothetical protein
MGELLKQAGAGEQAIVEIRDAAASIKRVANRLETEQGLFGRLLNDEAYADALAGDLEAALRNAAEITDKINRGEGTLGLLVNERALHDGAEEIVAGVNDSKFARWLARRYRKRGIKASERTPSASDPQASGP